MDSYSTSNNGGSVTGPNNLPQIWKRTEPENGIEKSRALKEENTFKYSDKESIHHVGHHQESINGINRSLGTEALKHSRNPNIPIIIIIWS